MGGSSNINTKNGDGKQISPLAGAKSYPNRNMGQRSCGKGGKCGTGSCKGYGGGKGYGNHYGNNSHDSYGRQGGSYGGSYGKGDCGGYGNHYGNNSYGSYGRQGGSYGKGDGGGKGYGNHYGHGGNGEPHSDAGCMKRTLANLTGIEMQESSRTVDAALGGDAEARSRIKTSLESVEFDGQPGHLGFYKSEKAMQQLLKITV